MKNNRIKRNTTTIKRLIIKETKYEMRIPMDEKLTIKQYFEETLPFWKNLKQEQKDKILHTSRISTFSAGESMNTGAGECAGLFLIKKGQVRAYILSDTGKEITLYRLLERDVCIFSASCMMKNITFDIFLEAEKETEAYLIPTGVYEEVSKQSIEASDYTNQILSSRFSDVMWIMEQVLFMSFDKRLALFLLEQSAMENSETFYMTQDVIARHLGSAREVVSRMLKYFSDEGYVKLARGKISIINENKLRELAEG